MRTLYDAVNADNILAADRTPEMVAGYIDKIRLEPWFDHDWALFPDAVKVQIVKKASTNAGHVLDVEPGDATPAEAPGWVTMRRAAGADPTVYCNASTWPTVRAAFAAAKVAEPHYWIARYDGDPTIPAGAVAKQYRGNVAPGYDVSSVVDHWPGVDPVPSNGGAAAPISGELMERKTLPKSASTTSARLWLAGTPGAAIIIRPRIGVDGYAANPVFLGDIFAWGNDHVGIGHNPKTDGTTTDFRLESHRRIDLPGAVWADLNYSSNDDFEVDIVG